MEILKEKIPKHIYLRLEIAEIYSLDNILIKSEQEICDETKLPQRDVTKVVELASELILKCNFRTVNDIASNEKLWSVLYSNFTNIDKVLNGIPIKGITEIYGESGTGKTQIALHFILQVQRIEENGGLNGGVVYISTEGNFPSKRLQQIIEFFPKLIKTNKIQNYMDEIFIEQIQDLDEFKHCVTIRLPVLLSRTIIKLIVIDSIAAVFRYDNESSDYVARGADLRLLATRLNNLSKHYNLAVICINQVASDPKYGIKPSLGLVWSNLIRKRIKISRSTKTVLYNNKIFPLRNLTVIYAPDTPRNSCSFIVTESGIVEIT